MFLFDLVAGFLGGVVFTCAAAWVICKRMIGELERLDWHEY
jgi:hypothetical protein